MPIGPFVTSQSLKQFIQVTDNVSTKYAKQLEGWTESPFAWVLTLPSRSRGAAGEEIVAQWLGANGFRVQRSGHSGCDRIINGINTEIKFSTLWKTGGYVFQQLRDQDYKYVFCLGLSPQDVHAWLIPKAVAWEHSTPQHGGKIGKDTRWFSFAAGSPPSWLTPYGGSLEDALHVLRETFR